MSPQIAFVGDVHGNIAALQAMLESIRAANIRRVVFLGDYVNKGPASREVIECLRTLGGDLTATMLRGNHETAFLDALDSGDVAPLLKAGGAPTIRSYVGGDVGPDVAEELRQAVPGSHVAFLRAMPGLVMTDTWVASHEPQLRPDRFAVSAHVFVGPVPEVKANSAQIDTGCGSRGGRLTAFLWPTREYLQVSEFGEVVRRAPNA